MSWQILQQNQLLRDQHNQFQLIIQIVEGTGRVIKSAPVERWIQRRETCRDKLREIPVPVIYIKKDAHV